MCFLGASIEDPISGRFLLPKHELLKGNFNCYYAYFHIKTILLLLKGLKRTCTFLPFALILPPNIKKQLTNVATFKNYAYLCPVS